MTDLDQKLTQEDRAELLAYLQPYLFKSPHRTLIIIFDSAGAGLATGIAGDVRIDYNCHITNWVLTGDAAGSIEVDIWRDSYVNFPPTIADTICGSDKPILSSSAKAISHSLTGWTTTIRAGDHLRFNIDSVSGLNRVTLTLELRGP